MQILPEAKEFARKHVEAIINGEKKRMNLENHGTPFSVERDAKELASFCEFLNSDLRKAIDSELP